VNRAIALIASTFLVLPPPSASAQASSTDTIPADTLRTQLSGTVRDSLGVPVAGASVLTTPGVSILTTDTAGRFVLRRAPVGRVNVLVRRLGFSPVDTQIVAHIGVNNVVDVVLDRLPQLLAEVVVQGDRQCRRYSLEGLLCRREVGLGHFIGYEDILAKRPVFLGDLLRDEPGFRVDVAPRGRTVRSVVGWRCIKSLVDGDEIKLTNPVPRPQDVFAIEVFQRGEVPPEYRHWPWRGKYPCTLVVYWTKRVLSQGLPR